MRNSDESSSRKIHIVGYVGDKQKISTTEVAEKIKGLMIFQKLLVCVGGVTEDVMTTQNGQKKTD